MSRIKIDQAGSGRKDRIVDLVYWSDAYVNELIADGVTNTNVLVNVNSRTGQSLKRLALEKSLPTGLPAAVTSPGLVQGTAALEGGYFGADGLWVWRGTSRTDTGRVGWCLLGPAYNAGPDINYVVDLIADRDLHDRPQRSDVRAAEGLRLLRLLAIEHPAARTAAIKALGDVLLAAELRDAVDAYPLHRHRADQPAQFGAMIYAQLGGEHFPGGRFAGTAVDAVYIGAPLWVYRRTMSVKGQ